MGTHAAWSTQRPLPSTPLASSAKASLGGSFQKNEERKRERRAKEYLAERECKIGRVLELRHKEGWVGGARGEATEKALFLGTVRVQLRLALRRHVRWEQRCHGHILYGPGVHRTQSITSCGTDFVSLPECECGGVCACGEDLVGPTRHAPGTVAHAAATCVSSASTASACSMASTGGFTRLRTALHAIAALVIVPQPARIITAFDTSG